MKIKDIINEFSKYDENTEVFIFYEEGHERIEIKFDVIKINFFFMAKYSQLLLD